MGGTTLLTQNQGVNDSWPRSPAVLVVLRLGWPGLDRPPPLSAVERGRRRPTLHGLLGPHLDGGLLLGLLLFLLVLLLPSLAPREFSLKSLSEVAFFLLLLFSFFSFFFFLFSSLLFVPFLFSVAAASPSPWLCLGEGRGPPGEEQPAGRPKTVQRKGQHQETKTLTLAVDLSYFTVVKIKYDSCSILTIPARLLFKFKM